MEWTISVNCKFLLYQAAKCFRRSIKGNSDSSLCGTFLKELFAQNKLYLHSQLCCAKGLFLKNSMNTFILKVNQRHATVEMHWQSSNGMTQMA